MFCRKCGKIIQAESVYCPECGAPTKNAQPVRDVQRQTPQAQNQPQQYVQQYPPQANQVRRREPGGKEKIVVRCRKHWGMFVGRGLIALLFLIMGFITEADDSTFLIVCIAIAVVVLLPAIISYFSDYLELTETKIVGHSGLINSRKISAPLSKVQNIELSNGLGGKILGYHDILVDNAGTGGKEFRFRKATNAEEFAEAVYARMR